MVKDHSYSEKGNPLPPHRLLLSINSKGSFICTDRITHTTAFVTPVVEYLKEMFLCKHALGQHILFMVIWKQASKQIFYLTTHSTHFIYDYIASDMIYDLSNSERGNPLPPHGLLFPINNKGYLICVIQQTG